MPNCFTLTRKSNIEAGPVKFITIDEEMCKHFNVPCDTEKYHAYWYDIYGLGLACGSTIQQIIERNAPNPEDDEGLKKAKLHVQEIGRWLDENFTSDAWYSHMK